MSRTVEPSTNPIAIAGLAFTGLTGALYVTAYFVAGALPTTAAEMESLNATPAVMTRFLVALGSAVLLNLVGFSLSVTGALLPRRPRVAAMLGILLSGVLFIGIPGVIVLGLMGA